MARPNKGPQPILYGPDTKHGAKKKAGQKAYIWHAVWYDGGKRRIRSLDVEHGGDYRQALAAVVAEWAADKPVNNLTDMTVARALEIYILEHAQFVVSARSLIFGCKSIAKAIGDLRVDEINRAQCHAFANRWKSPHTARAYLKILTAALNHCAANGHIPAAPKIWKPQGLDGRQITLTRRQIAQIVRGFRARGLPHWAFLTVLLYHTASRVGVGVALRWEPSSAGGLIDLDRNIIEFNPRGRPRTSKRKPTVPIPVQLLPLLRAIRRNRPDWEGPAIPKGMLGTKGAYGTAFNWLCRDLGLSGATPHVIRHTRITEMVVGGIPVAVVSEFAGVSVQVLMKVYAHVIPDHLSAAATFRRRASTAHTAR